jgi:nucleotide-binding universal stress UspA family protein
MNPVTPVTPVSPVTPVTGRKVVVGVSGAPADDAALAWSVRECRANGARLVIAHACFQGGDDDAAALAVHPGLTVAVDQARRELGADRVTVRVQAPPSGAMLLGLVGPGDLLVVGPPSRGRWTHWGSTTQYVARHASCPVVITHSGEPVEAAYAGHVVVGIDGSSAARAAMGFAFSYADEHGLPVVAVMVTPDGHRGDGVESAAAVRLAAEVEPWQRRYPTVPSARALFAGRPVDGLLQAAQGARLLVLGAHAGPSSRRVLLGSTSLDAISRATCPVAILQPPPDPTEHPVTPKEVHDVRA